MNNEQLQQLAEEKYPHPKPFEDISGYDPKPEQDAYISGYTDAMKSLLPLIHQARALAVVGDMPLELLNEMESIVNPPKQ